MTSTVVLTSDIREIPYFSSFSPDEEIVVIPRPLINETINYTREELENVDFNHLVTMIENCVYLCIDIKDSLIKELMWRLGETEEKMKTLTDLPDIVQREVNSKIKQKVKYHDPFNVYVTNYMYGIRCRLKPFHINTYNSIAEHGDLRLLKWAHNEGCWRNKWACIHAAKKRRYRNVKVFT